LDVEMTPFPPLAPIDTPVAPVNVAEPPDAVTYVLPVTDDIDTPNAPPTDTALLEEDKIAFPAVDDNVNGPD